MTTGTMVLLLFISLFAVMVISYRLTKDWINPVILAVVGIFINFTLNYLPLSDLQTPDYSFSYNFFYWVGLFSLVVTPLIFMAVLNVGSVKKPVIVLRKERFFSRCQTVIAIFYVCSNLLKNWLLSGHLIPIILQKINIHTTPFPVLSSYVIPFFGAFIVFEGFFFRKKLANFTRIALFLTAPLTAGSRLLPTILFGIFFLGYFLNHEQKIKTLLKIGLVVLLVFTLFFTVGVTRSNFYNPDISRIFAGQWGIRITGFRIVDEMIAVYWRYFVITFENFKRLVETVTPINEPLEMVSYPLATFMQFDNLLGMPLRTEYLAKHFDGAIGGVRMVNGFFGPFYLYGGIAYGSIFVLMYGFAVTWSYIFARRTVRWYPIYMAFGISLLLGSFTNMFFSARIVTFVIAAYIGLDFFTRCGVLVTRRKKTISSGPERKA